MAENDDEKLVQTFYAILTMHEKQNILPDGDGEPYELSQTRLQILHFLQLESNLLEHIGPHPTTFESAFDHLFFSG